LGRNGWRNWNIGRLKPLPFKIRATNRGKGGTKRNQGVEKKITISGETDLGKPLGGALTVCAKKSKPESFKCEVGQSLLWGNWHSKNHTIPKTAFVLQKDLGLGGVFPEGLFMVGGTTAKKTGKKEFTVWGGGGYQGNGGCITMCGPKNKQGRKTKKGGTGQQIKGIPRKSIFSMEKGGKEGTVC